MEPTFTNNGASWWCVNLMNGARIEHLGTVRKRRSKNPSVKQPHRWVAPE
jgi:hypothetical protein